MATTKAKIKNELLKLEKTENSLYNKFIEKYKTLIDRANNRGVLRPKISIDLIDIKSYYVLFHSAVEEFFEKITEIIVYDAIDNWHNGHKQSKQLTYLLFYYCLRDNADEDNTEKLKHPSGIADKKANLEIYDIAKMILALIKKDFENTIKKNHGVSSKYIYKFLFCSGIDISAIPLINLKINQLDELANKRGLYAHTASHKTKHEDRLSEISIITGIKTDVLFICQKVVEKATS